MDDGEPVVDPPQKKLRIGKLALDTVDEILDYIQLLYIADIDYMNKSKYTNESVRKGKAAGLKILDDFGVYTIHPSNAAEGRKYVDTTWAISSSSHLNLLSKSRPISLFNISLPLNRTLILVLSPSRIKLLIFFNLIL